MNPFLWSYTATLVTTLMTTATSGPASVDSKATTATVTTPVTKHGSTMEGCVEVVSKVGPGTDDDAQPWIRRYAPRRRQVELGAYVGVLLLSRQHELYQPDPADPNGGYEPLSPGSPMVGGRLSASRRRWLAFEVEGGAAYTRTAGGASATVWHASGSVVGQVARWSVVPFVLVGVGALGISSKAPGSVGRDIDATLHFGGGVKVNVNKRFMVRLDVHDILAAGHGVANGLVHNREVLLGASIRMGRNPEK